MRLIDADEMIKNLKAMETMYDAIELDGMIKGLEESKTVDAEPVRHGRWESDMYFDEPVTRCTACKRGFAVGHKAERFQFGPNCGAKMRCDNES